MSTAPKLLHGLVLTAYLTVAASILVQALPMSALVNSPPVGRLVLATVGYLVVALLIEGFLRRYRPQRADRT